LTGATGDVDVIYERDPPLPPTRSERFKAWLERHRWRLAVAFALVYLAFFVACLLTPSAWIDDSVYVALPWWSLVHRALDVALAWMGARWLAQQMMRRP
jgi:hypothetical protein